MKSVERSKKKVQIWKKATVHFAICFTMGFLTGIAPSSKSSNFSSSKHVTSESNTTKQIQTWQKESASNDTNIVIEAPMPTSTTPTRPKQHNRDKVRVLHIQQEETEQPSLVPKRIIIIVTPTSSKDSYKGILLRRLANTIRLVSQPLLWIVVEKLSDSDEVSEILRKTGIMYRHLVFKENFTDYESELDHQRNVALRHIEHHKLSGIVHFAGLFSVYDLSFFDELREIDMFGTWPMATLSRNKKKVIIEGPVCDSSQVIGWHLKQTSNKTTNLDTTISSTPQIHISSFGFNSSILWDPERWGRSSSIQHSSQNSIKFVKQVALEDETKLKGLPQEDCSKIMLWRLDFHQKRTNN